MARAYSNDLRVKLLEAHASGKGSLTELADRFGVSPAYVLWTAQTANAYNSRLTC